MRYKSTPLSSRYPRPKAPLPRPARPISRSNPVAAWLATLVMVLLIPALVVPTLLVRAAQPTLAAPGTTVAGATITVTGNDFSPGARGRIVLDRQAIAYQVAPSGRFAVQLTIPTTMKNGRHRVVAVELDSAGRPVREIARTSIRVEPRKLSSIVASNTPTAAPTATPELTTPSPRPPATPSPTPVPTQAPTVAPVVTAAPLAPTAAPVVTAAPVAPRRRRRSPRAPAGSSSWLPTARTAARGRSPRRG